MNGIRSVRTTNSWWASVGASQDQSKLLGALISRVLRGSKPRGRRPGRARSVDQRGPVVKETRQSQTRLSASNRSRLLAAYAAGAPVQELTARFGVHRGTVWEMARRTGLDTRTPALSEQTRQEAARLYRHGLTLVQTAEQIGISDEAVRAAVVACGGTIRPRGRRVISVVGRATSSRTLARSVGCLRSRYRT